ncbi:AbfB domain-containing protein [Stigmatella sp. ncwal1]|uniref:AbfB domain-containing protein n=1 Tax=Stigmatella ashevillensis TaxID=2995309 RepID=A0ABT5DJ94_9BACT|nr:AbfB domain-containing protein [Stigmatella ashevillena]MDC0713714.1 AbfB domain-containing protein [Stigmatella ashevillena]
MMNRLLARTSLLALSCVPALLLGACGPSEGMQSPPSAHPRGTDAQALAAAATYTGYVMGYFTESPARAGNDYGLHLAYSTDSLNWTPLNGNKAVVTPTLGTKGLRDPFIFRKQDGTFVILATDMLGTDFSQSSPFLHIWDSTDLRSFSNERLVRMNTAGMHAWAPEAFYDASRNQYGIIWSGNTDRNRIYVNYTTDFVTVSTPQVYFDPGFSVLDATLHTDSGVHYLYYKRESDNTLLGAKSASLNPGSFNATTYTGALAHGVIEAPIVVKQLNSNTWYLWGDSYVPVNGVFYVWKSTSIGSNAWAELNKRAYNQPLNSKHASIALTTSAEQANLIAKWGNPDWNRIKSYNYPERYVRHINLAARIDEYAFDPYTDSQWKLVPGLADPAGISFQSVSHPTSYLRHSNNVLVLHVNDNSALFKADATFYKAAGFADAAWTSFKSYNNPTLFIRHSGFVLRMDPVTGSSDAVTRQDATFLLTY